MSNVGGGGGGGRQTKQQKWQKNHHGGRGGNGKRGGSNRGHKHKTGRAGATEKDNAGFSPTLDVNRWSAEKAPNHRRSLPSSVQIDGKYKHNRPAETSVDDNPFGAVSCRMQCSNSGEWRKLLFFILLRCCPNGRHPQVARWRVEGKFFATDLRIRQYSAFLSR